MRRFGVLTLRALLSAAAVPRQDHGLLKAKPDSDERRASSTAFKGQAPSVTRVFAPHVYVNRKGERMPYRLFTPARLERGKTYALVVFLHGSSGSGTDNARSTACPGRFPLTVPASM